jgi:hypothetical protein
MILKESPVSDMGSFRFIGVMNLPVSLSRLALVVLLGGSLLWLVYRRLWRRRPYPLPPGPPGRFLVGNLGQLSVEDPAQDYIRWGKEYSSVERATPNMVVADQHQTGM